MAHRQAPSGAGGGLFMNGDSGTVVAGERLKQVDTPVETLLGATNGAVSGGLLSCAISAAVTFGREGHGNLAQKVFRNITGSHMVAVISGTAAMAALGGLVRFSRASKHNEWSEKHYDYLENRRAASFVDQAQQEKSEAMMGPPGR